MSEWYSKIPPELLKEWDQKLAEAGHKEIETGLGRDGHMLRGQTPSFRLIAATGQSRRTFDEVADAEADIYDYQQGDKAEYYRLAEQCCVRLAHRLLPEQMYCWCLHSQGIGERLIERLTDIPRARVREHLIPLKSEIKRLTTTPVMG